MPTPKAKCRLASRSRTTSSGRSKTSGSRLPDGKVAFALGASADFGVFDDFAGHGHGREHAEELLGGGVDELGFVAEAAAVVGVGGEVQQ